LNNTPGTRNEPTNEPAFEEYSLSTKEVIEDFLSGKLMALRKPNEGKEYSNMDYIASAFKKHGFKLNRDHAYLASADVHVGKCSTIYDSEFWNEKSLQALNA
jgi:hypothetical protein